MRGKHLERFKCCCHSAGFHAAQRLEVANLVSEVILIESDDGASLPAGGWRRCQTSECSLGFVSKVVKRGAEIGTEARQCCNG